MGDQESMDGRVVDITGTGEQREASGQGNRSAPSGSHAPGSATSPNGSPASGSAPAPSGSPASGPDPAPRSSAASGPDDASSGSPGSASEPASIDEAEVEIQSKVDEILDAARGRRGRPPILRIHVERVRPERYACHLPSIDVQRDEPIDLEQIWRRYGGGTYHLQLRRGGRYVAAASHVTIAGEPLVYEGVGNPWGAAPAPPQQQQSQQQTPGELAAIVDRFGTAITELAQGIAGMREHTNQAIESLRSDLVAVSQQRHNPGEELRHTLGTISEVMDAVEKFRPAAAPEAPALPATDTGDRLAVVNAILDRLPSVISQVRPVLGSLPAPAPAAPAATPRADPPSPNRRNAGAGTPPAAAQDSPASSQKKTRKKKNKGTQT